MHRACRHPPWPAFPGPAAVEVEAQPWPAQHLVSRPSETVAGAEAAPWTAPTQTARPSGSAEAGVVEARHRHVPSPVQVAAPAWVVRHHPSFPQLWAQEVAVAARTAVR